MPTMKLYTLMAQVPTVPQLPTGGWPANEPKELQRQLLIRANEEPPPSANDWFLALDYHPNRALYSYVGRCAYLHNHLQKSMPAGTTEWPSFLKWPSRPAHRQGAYIIATSTPTMATWGWPDQTGESMVLVIMQDSVDIPTVPQPDVVERLAGMDRDARLQVFGRFCAVCGTPLIQASGPSLNRCAAHTDERLDRLMEVVRESILLDGDQIPPAPCHPFASHYKTCCELVAPHTCLCACHSRRIDYVIALQEKAQRIFTELFGHRETQFHGKYPVPEDPPVIIEQ